MGKGKINLFLEKSYQMPLEYWFNNYFKKKKNYYGKRNQQVIFFFTAFYISNESGIKTFLK